MFSLLSDKLDDAFRKLRGLSHISESNIKEAMRDIRMALLDADVEYSVAREFIAHVKEQAMGEKVLKTVRPGEQIVKIFRDELAELLGGDATELDLTPPARILVVGLNGAGKTTTSAKLARRLKKEGHKPLLVACDLVRPAAIDQLATLASQIEVPVYTPSPTEKDVIRVAKDALRWAEGQEHDVMIFDTAGRQEVDEPLVAELRKLAKFLNPQEALLVADAATGQQAVRVAQTFDAAVGLTGIILTKLDGDARGGAALSMRAVTGKPIKFIGEGEKLDMFGPFVPLRMADRILGMGDIVGLVEKAAEKIDEKSAMNAMNRMMSGEFNFNDFLNQMHMMRSLGPLEGLLKLLPGFGKIRKMLPDNALDQSRMKRMEAIVLSMTKAERLNYKLLIPSRRRRIAKGAGVSEIEVNRFIKQFREMKEMMSGKGAMGGLMKSMFKGGKPGAAPAGMPDLSSMMGADGKPDLSKMPDLSALEGLGGGAARAPKIPKGLGGFSGLFRRR
ncbi:MAG TPA: signal recognition particle protein [Candidatus Akkermansia intestinigallinarum]|uniref:Signal recognition particle protein n=1 Tax=Candidatus Akkermansia intestinigallinarum TaxID=2838431 RepID=A0A9D1VC49_9BACT|nr:signal recognition particle protein [Candidatus Akkermansia intestinigallinarum]